jgi:hypothetical protein
MRQCIPAGRHRGPRLPRDTGFFYNERLRTARGFVTGTSFNGRTPRSGRGYWGSNPYVPASLRSPFGRASARSRASGAGRTTRRDTIMRRLSRRSCAQFRQRRRTSFSRTHPQVKVRMNRVLLGARLAFPRILAFFQQLRTGAKDATGAARCAASGRDSSTSCEAKAIRIGITSDAPPTSRIDSRGTTTGRAALPGTTGRGRLSYRWSFPMNLTPLDSSAT